MKEIVINSCYGGFSISNKALVMLAEKQGKKIYFYEHTHYGHRDGKDLYTRVEPEGEAFFTYALTKDLGETTEELPDDDDLWFSKRDIPRDDPELINLVKTLGSSEVSGNCANLKIVEIPDDVEWEIEEYDGVEWVSEEHRRWS